MFNKWETLSCTSKIVYLLSLCDKILPYLKEDANYKFVEEAMDRCWQWIIEKNIDADDLYFYLENLEDTGILTLMQFTNDERKLALWICTANALLFTLYNAYKFQEEVYLPETVEQLNEREMFNEFMDNFSKIYSEPDEMEEILYRNLKDGKLNEMSRHKISKLLNKLT
ncbi:Imm6 family immunity protein [Listeria fleischmannii]|uniref:Imm6 family immunity protein n=1 Tax=Listeria fleischmannii TaxID=1069827 RepID=UPI0016281ABE|nr:Imm6 family immunity protein [Listeria fleischmannii]MBC1417823.1 hypothetical protein [Listeria fleischmannii]